ncbi:MAG TPA: hypothetical protein VGH11_17055, partial [Jatrophihabitans sp.]
MTITPLTQLERSQRGISGPALRVARGDGKPATTDVLIRLDRAAVNGLYGANFADRVRWVEVPDGPGVVNSAVTRPLVSSVDPKTGAVTISPAAISPSSAGPVVLMAIAAPQSTTGTGDFTSTSLSPSASWQVSAQTGSFSWTYPLRVPPVAAGPTPSVSLSYDSGSIDGETGSTNNQPSAVGDGWNLAGAGFIERSYAPCATDGGAPTSGDQCWKSDNATMSFGGHSGHLVRVGTTNEWRLESDDGSRIERLTGAINGDNDGEYWKLTTTDGTQYFFGMNDLPGWTSGQPTTNSTWTVPAFGNNVGEPCYSPVFANASCSQAWRWNLDYVVTPHDTSEAYYYTSEANSYARNGTTIATYVRGGQLARIDYGMTRGSELTTNAPARVVFDNVSRCISGSVCDSAHPASWPDVPWDQQCNASPCTGLVSPTFFTTLRLSLIHTQVLSGAAYSDVDAWSLTHSFPNPGDGQSAALWLSSIGHTGYASATSSVTLPNVVFSGTALQNRITVTDGLALQYKYRISSVLTESGASIAVQYSPQQCGLGNLPAPASNGMRCFPQWWSPTGQNPKVDWFHKYVVTQVSANARTGGAQPSDDTFYDYIGTPGWRYERSPMVPDHKKTWSNYAGYSQVRIRHGNDSVPSSQQTTTYVYFRGMNGDRLNATGGAKSVSVTASDGTSVADALWFAGRVRESVVSNGNGGPRTAIVLGARVSNTISTPWASAPTATGGTFTARYTSDADVVTHTALGGGGDRRTEVMTGHDSRGRVHSVNDLGDISTASDDRCTTTDYADNESAWLLSFASEVTVVGKACGAAASYPIDAVSDSRTFYDGSATLGAAPTRGDPTRTDVASGYSGSTAQWTTTSTFSYDALGRVLTTTDPRTVPARTSSNAYVPAGNGLPTQLNTTNPLGWVTTTDLDPRWGLPIKVTDQNSHVTEASYDPLGRRSQVWLPDRLRALNTVASTSYAYVVSDTGPTTIATTSLNPAGGTFTSFALYDGLLRPTQSQVPAEGGGRDITDTLYDGAGEIVIQNQTYFTTDAVSGTLFVPATSIPLATQTNYDGAGRKTADVTLLSNHEAWRTSYGYGGNYIDETPPAGATATRTFSDARGQTTELDTLHTPSDFANVDKTRYGYDASGHMTSMTDALGNVWTWKFDVLGQQTFAADPDKGNTQTSYDSAGRVTSTQAATGSVLAYKYDVLDRKVEEHDGTLTGALLASWTYDTVS